MGTRRNIYADIGRALAGLLFSVIVVEEDFFDGRILAAIVLGANVEFLVHVCLLAKPPKLS
jgi:hypothetical protein